MINGINTLTTSIKPASENIQHSATKHKEVAKGKLDSVIISDFFVKFGGADFESITSRYADLREELFERYGHNPDELYKRLGELNLAFEYALAQANVPSADELYECVVDAYVGLDGKPIEFQTDAEFRRVMMQELLRVARENAEALRQWAEVMAEEMERLRLILLIAARIAAGDNVPPEDREFLLANSPGMYMVANATRVEKEHPNDYESALSDDENDEYGTADTTSSEGGSVSASVPSAPSATAAAAVSAASA